MKKRAPEGDLPAVGDFHVAHQDAGRRPAQRRAEHQGDALAMFRRRSHQESAPLKLFSPRRHRGRRGKRELPRKIVMLECQCRSTTLLEESADPNCQSRFLFFVLLLALPLRPLCLCGEIWTVRQATAAGHGDAEFLAPGLQRREDAVIKLDAVFQLFLAAAKAGFAWQAHAIESRSWQRGAAGVRDPFGLTHEIFAAAEQRGIEYLHANIRRPAFDRVRAAVTRQRRRPTVCQRDQRRRSFCAPSILESVATMKMSTALAPGTQAPDFSLRSTPDQLRSRLRFVFWSFRSGKIHPDAQHAAEAAEAGRRPGPLLGNARCTLRAPVGAGRPGHADVLHQRPAPQSRVGSRNSVRGAAAGVAETLTAERSDSHGHDYRQ